MDSRYIWAPAVLFCVGLFGCPASSGTEDSGAESTDTGESESESTFDPDAGDAGDDDTDTFNDDDANDEADGEFDPCEFLSCGDGTCFVSDGEATCDCAPGLFFDGAQCQPCDSLDGDEVAVDIETISLEGSITINGEAPPADESDSGELWLVSPVGDDEVLLGSTADGAYEALVTPGHYEVWYRADGVSHNVTPVNTNQRVVEGRRILSSGDLGDIDLRVVEVEFDVRVDAVPLPETPSDDGVLRLVGIGSTPGDEAPIGLTSEPLPAVPVLVGEYFLTYSVDDAGPIMPANTNGVVQVVELDEQPAMQVVEAALETTTLGNDDFTLNGLPFPETPDDSGRLVLKRGDDVVDLGSTAELGPVRVLDTVYDVHFQSVSPGTTPINADVLFGAIEPPNDTQADLPTNVVDFTLTLDGGPVPALDVEAGELWLQDLHNETDVFLLAETVPNFSAPIALGEYHLLYRAVTPDVALPHNTNGVLSELLIDGNPEIDLDIPTLSVSGTFTLDQQPPPANPDITASVRLTNAQTGDEVVLGQLHEQTYSRRIVPGTYEVRYSYGSGEGIPQNPNGLLFEADLASDVALDIDVALRAITRVVTLNQGPAPSELTDSGSLTLSGLMEILAAGTTAEESVTLDVLPGGYSVRYSSDAAGGLTPENSNARVACFTVE